MATRRELLSRGAMGAVAGLTGVRPAETQAAGAPGPDVRIGMPKRPVIITRETGDHAVSEAYEMLVRGADTLEAALHVCGAREDDPGDHSVGYSGLPNEDGVVQLDACCMHGPTRRCGAVGAVEDIRHVGLLARTVMERSSHVMMAGAGARAFGVAEGFKTEDLLTDDARKIWLLWKEHGRGWWGPGIDAPGWVPPKDAEMPGSGGRASLLPRHPEREQMPRVLEQMKQLAAAADRMGVQASLRRQAVREVLWPTTGTIHVSALNARGEISGATTTSGMAWKIPGRLGDSPVIGAGCFTDPDVGSAGATGNGEENIKVMGAHTIVEMMRRGASPKEAGLEALRRIARNYNNDMTRLRYLDMIYYILRRDGAYAGVSLWSTRGIESRKKFVVHDGEMRVEACDFLFEGTTLSMHPF